MRERNSHNLPEQCDVRTACLGIRELTYLEGIRGKIEFIMKIR
jgi:hypothetical protein